MTSRCLWVGRKLPHAAILKCVSTNICGSDQHMVRGRAAVVIVGDLIPERLEQARSFGCEAIDISKGDPKDQIEQILGVPEVDAAVDAVGFEARGHGADSEHEAPATVCEKLASRLRVHGEW